MHTFIQVRNLQTVVAKFNKIAARIAHDNNNNYYNSLLLDNYFILPIKIGN